MKKYTTHFILYSEQTIPNMLPLLCIDTRPREVVFLLTPLMQKNKEKLQRIVEWVGSLDIKVTTEALGAFAFEEIQRRVGELADRFSGEGALALNATGGTKIMSFGAIEAFRNRGLDCFYIDTQNRQYLQLVPDFSAIEMSHNLFSVYEYISAVGYSPCEHQRPVIDARRQEWIELLLEDPKKWQVAVSSLNFFAGLIKPPRFKEPWKIVSLNVKKALYDRNFRQLVQKAHELELLRLEDQALRFHDKSCWDFIRGGWLELYSAPMIEHMVQDHMIRDSAFNLVVESPKKVRNELDVAFTAGNRLHIIECKSGKMKAGKETRVDSIIYKLDNLRDLVGGDYGKAMLLCYWGLDDDDRRRLSENQIQFVEGKGLLGLESRLRNWIKV